MKKATFDPAKRLDLYFRINRNGSKAFVFLNSDGSARSLIYEEYEMTIKEYAGGRISIAIPLSITDNTITASITDALSKVNEGEYYWELKRVDNGKTYLCGKAFFHNGIFDGVDEESTELVINEGGETIEITVNESGGSGETSITGENGIDVTNGVATLGSPMTKNTTILGELFNFIFGTPDSRFNQFLIRVNSLFEVLIPSGGAWRAVVDNAQAIVSGNSIAFLHDLIIEFSRSGSESSVLDIVTEPGNEQVRSNAPVVLKQINSQEELDALDPNQYAGSFIFKNFSTGIQTPQPIYSNGGWKSIRQIIDISTDILNAVIFGTGVPVHRIVIGQDVSEIGYYYESTLVLELMSNTAFTLICTADFSSGDQQIMSINRNAQGTYIVTTKISLMIEVDTPTWLISVHVAGPADISQTGHLIVAKDPSEFFDIFFTGTIASNNQLYHRFNTKKTSTAE